MSRPMARTLERSDEGTTVRTADGDEIGTIQLVQGANGARVEPVSGIAGSLRKRLGWSAQDANVYELPHSRVASFDDDAVHLNH